MAALVTNSRSTGVRPEHSATLLARNVVQTVRQSRFVDEFRVVAPELGFGFLVTGRAVGDEVRQPVCHEVTIEQHERPFVVYRKLSRCGTTTATVSIPLSRRPTLLNPVRSAVVPVSSTPLRVVWSDHEGLHEFDSALASAEVPFPHGGRVLLRCRATLVAGNGNDPRRLHPRMCSLPESVASLAAKATSRTFGNVGLDLIPATALLAS